MTDEETMLAYLQLKVSQRDWHAVADAAMDLREMQALREAAPLVQPPHPPTLSPPDAWLPYLQVLLHREFDRLFDAIRTKLDSA